MGDEVTDIAMRRMRRVTNDSDELMVAQESFVTLIDGEERTALAGKTRVRRGDPLFRARPEAWKVFDAAETPPALV